MSELEPGSESKVNSTSGRPNSLLLQYGLVTLAAAGVLIGSHFMKKSGPPVVAGRIEAACPEPSPWAEAATRKFFADRSIRDIDLGSPWIPPAAHAKDLGLTPVPRNKALDEMYNFAGSQTEYPDTYTPTPFKDLNTASQYLGNFGISVQEGMLNGSVDGMHNPTSTELKTDMRDDLAQMTWEIQFLPVEYVHLSGLKKIILMYGNKSNSDAYYFPTDSTLVWNIQGEPTYNYFSEAIYEGIDEAECGGNQLPDPTYNSFNPRPNIYGPAKNHKGLNELNFIDHLSRPSDVKRGQQAMKAYDAKNYKKYCRLQDEFAKEEHTQVVADTEGFSDLNTDKYEVGARLQWPYNNYNDLLDRNNPVLRNKAELLLARLYDLSPRIAKYFAAISGRAFKDQVDCAKY